MKRRIGSALLLLSLLSAVVSGCGSGEAAASEEPAESASAVDYSGILEDPFETEPVVVDWDDELDQYITFYTEMFCDQYAPIGLWQEPQTLPAGDKALVVAMNLVRLKGEGVASDLKFEDSRWVIPEEEMQAEAARLFGHDEHMDLESLAPPLQYDRGANAVLYTAVHDFGNAMIKKRDSMINRESVQVTHFAPDDMAREHPLSTFQYRFERAERQDGRPYLRLEKYQLEKLYWGDNEAFVQLGLDEAVSEETMGAVKIFDSDPATAGEPLPHLLEKLDYQERGQWLLIIPRQSQQLVTVETLRFDEAEGAYVVDEMLLDTVCGKSWGLLVRMEMPEDSPTLRIAFRNGYNKAAYTPLAADRSVKDGLLLIEDMPAAHRFRQGQHGDALTELSIGQALGEFTLESAPRDETKDSLVAEFSGEAILTGELYVHGADDPMYGSVSFYPDAESEARLPYWEYDSRPIWMVLDNAEEIMAMTGEGGKLFADCKLHIRGYHYDSTPRMTANSTYVVEVLSLGEGVPTSLSELLAGHE